MGQKILVVEDNELNLKLFCDLLRAHGYAAEPVRDGREAVERARAFRPDLIVMDIQMPHVSGLELIEQLKGDEELRRTPIMAVTAYAAKGDEERIREAGAEGYVSKPISVVRFVEAVRALIDRPRPVEAVARVTRALAASPDAVFDAWLDEERVGRWLFATPDGEMVRVSLDPRVGGRFEIVERRDGEDILHTGTYEAIEPPERLEFTLAVPKYSPSSSLVTIAIAPMEGGSQLTLSQSVPEGSPASPDRIEHGWATVLEGLARTLEGEEG